MAEVVTVPATGGVNGEARSAESKPGHSSDEDDAGRFM
jgi:hypothetical protein